jgi:hypothetical protein
MTPTKKKPKTTTESSFSGLEGENKGKSADEPIDAQQYEVDENSAILVF